MAKILLIDIETAPALSYHWGMYDQEISPQQVVHDWYMLCYAAKWLGNVNVMFDSIYQHREFRDDPRSDKSIAGSIWKLMNEADIIVAHNGDEFDVKKIQTVFLKHEMKPPSPFRTVDTLKEVKRSFGFLSNKLDNLLRRLKMGQKLQHTGFSLWTNCMEGNGKAWREMRRYNIQDVIGLEKIYLAIRPYIKNHPNIATINGTKTSCPNCGGSKIERRGFGFTNASKYQRYRCECGKWFRGK